MPILWTASPAALITKHHGPMVMLRNLHPHASSPCHYYGGVGLAQSTPDDHGWQNSIHNQDIEPVGHTQTLHNTASEDTLNGVAANSLLWPTEKRGLKLRFEFLKPGDPGPSDIWITFDNESKAYIGRDAENYPKQPTMWLNMYRDNSIRGPRKDASGDRLISCTNLDTPWACSMNISTLIARPSGTIESHKPGQGGTPSRYTTTTTEVLFEMRSLPPMTQSL
ncbi:hypothetical protein MRS44_013304 [Fusarium solani]|uniref:uncharacterized protein n=1 Tax=Fusarium solani TaxID=169388 RepID=UPI0032C42CDC|nr:hypothetical protein MRS44_013304 [Fusarium solani]